MFRLRLDAALCICCAICVDICALAALALRPVRRRGLEGHLTVAAPGDLPALGGFPSLVTPSACDGCTACMDECPVGALTINAVVQSERV